MFSHMIPTFVNAIRNLKSPDDVANETALNAVRLDLGNHVRICFEISHNTEHARLTVRC